VETPRKFITAKLHIVSTDENLGLRIEINLRGVSTNKTIIIYKVSLV
jgi:hypothetical protein